MSDKPQQKRFDELMGLLLENELDSKGLKELVALVKDHPELSKQLQHQLELDQKLILLEQDESFCEHIEAALDAREDDFTDRVMNLTEIKTERRNTLPWALCIASLAACLMMAFSLFFTRPQEPTDDGVAVISHLSGSLAQNLTKGDTIQPGMLELKEGYMSIEFYGGARMNVAGPAKLELIDAMQVKCLQGKIRTHVPKVARGFKIFTPDSKLIDLGTEFGLDVSENGSSELHVFDGEVEAYNAAGHPSTKKLVTAGLALKSNSDSTFPATDEAFEELLHFESREREHIDKRFKAWQENQKAYRKDDRLITYYDFESTHPNSRNLENQSTLGKDLNGAIVGAQWGEGPWPGKKALNFKRPGDRVRVYIPDEYESITLASWVRVDGLDRTNSSLILTDGYDLNEVHWQLKSDGRMSLGLHHSDPQRKTYLGHSVVNLKTLGIWMHLATVVDNKSGYMYHYKNGELVRKMKLVAKTPLRFGFASIGNWDEPMMKSGPIRNFNGAMAELMIFKTALNDAEIRKLSLYPFQDQSLQL